LKIDIGGSSLLEFLLISGRNVVRDFDSLRGFNRLKLESDGILSIRGRDIKPLAISVDVAVCGSGRRDLRIGFLVGDVGIGGTEEERGVPFCFRLDFRGLEGVAVVSGIDVELL
jgi:hypothetical protein